MCTSGVLKLNQHEQEGGSGLYRHRTEQGGLPQSKRLFCNNHQLNSKGSFWMLKCLIWPPSPATSQRTRGWWPVHPHEALVQVWLVCEGSSWRKHILWKCAHYIVFKAYFGTYCLNNVFTTWFNGTFFQLFQINSTLFPDIFLSCPGL